MNFLRIGMCVLLGAGSSLLNAAAESKAEAKGAGASGPAAASVQSTRIIPRDSLGRYFKPEVVKQYVAIMAHIEAGKQVYIMPDLFSVFGKQLKDHTEPTWLLGEDGKVTSFKGSFDDTSYTFVATRYSSSSGKIYKAEREKRIFVAVQISKSSDYCIYELDASIDFVHLAILSNIEFIQQKREENLIDEDAEFQRQRLNFLVKIPHADNPFLCRWPKYDDGNTTFTVISNLEDNSGLHLLGHVTNERTLFSSLPSYLQRILLKNHPFLKTSDQIQWASDKSLLPNVKAKLRIAATRARQRTTEWSLYNFLHTQHNLVHSPLL